MRDAILDYLLISDQNALNFLVGEPSKALYRACTWRRLKRLFDKRKKGELVGLALCTSNVHYCSIAENTPSDTKGWSKMA